MVSLRQQPLLHQNVILKPLKVPVAFFFAGFFTEFLCLKWLIRKNCRHRVASIAIDKKERRHKTFYFYAETSHYLS